ncbi:MAG: GntR family transcriptional regulator [Erysipelotrichaceae bacterium]|nr:GntR family transcriptional regulator [Erysipelotrichaceae bacterium]
MMFSSERPIYMQLVEQIRNDIISGLYKGGDRLPSVRDLAVQMEVNPNTLQKALSQLEQEGLIYTKRNVGKFVTEETARIDSGKQEQAVNLTKHYILQMRQIGCDSNEILQKVKGELNEQSSY